MKAYQHIQVIFEGKVMEVVLNRPGKRNAIDEIMAAELTDVFDWAAHNQDVRVMILRGKGPVFCAGADLKFMQRTDLEGSARPSAVLAKLFQATYLFRKPLIVVSHGKAMGGALGLIAAADFVLATTDAEFAFSEVKLGLVPATISPYVTKRTGERKARQLMLLGGTFSAEEAMDAGLVDKTGDLDALEAYKSYLCNHFIHNAPGAMMTTKRTIQHISNVPLDEHAITHTLKVLDDTRAGAEAREGMQAFLEKRKAWWQQ